MQIICKELMGNQVDNLFNFYNNVFCFRLVNYKIVEIMIKKSRYYVLLFHLIHQKSLYQ